MGYTLAFFAGIVLIKAFPAVDNYATTVRNKIADRIKKARASR